METIYSESSKIKKNKKKLEKALKVKISFSGKNVSVSGSAINEYTAIQVLEALNLGFTLQEALLLCDGDFIFEKVYIKDITKRHDLERIRARIIGKRGKTKEIIENLGDCEIGLHNNTVGIIGRAEDIEKAMQAVTSIIRGSKHSKVYGYLERERRKEKRRLNEDLGLK